jgi:predicted ArsR family transcriptional regulator
MDRRITRIAALAEPVRRALYRYVVGQAEPASREQAAAAVGVAHHVAKFNLDKLEEEGLLEAEFSRPAGKGGPGAGRPAKRYRRALREVQVSIPDRRYDLAGQVMADAIATAERSAVPIGEALSVVAREKGRSLGAAAESAVGGGRPGVAKYLRAVGEVLDEHGYEPRTVGRRIELANCPFHSLAQEHTELVCGMNLDLVTGVLEGLGADRLCATLEPAPGMCCVAIAAGP